MTGDPPASCMPSVMLNSTEPPATTVSFAGPDVIMGMGGTVSIQMLIARPVDEIPALSVATMEISHSPSSSWNVQGDVQGCGS